MKKLLAIMLSLFVVSSMVFAKPTAQLDFATMNKADTQFLFQDGAKVATLGKAEMKETEGEFWPIFWGVVFYTTAYLNAPSYNDHLYSGHPYASGRWRWLNWGW